MALIEPGFYDGPALIVGDGNFSFSSCLAKSGITSSVIFATSFDAETQLETNPTAIENIEQLSAFPSFHVLHGVDATDLDETFKDRLFHKIIFNFPHTGGKLKISKCRDLLGRFFVSAAKHIQPGIGVVCVSLCQGQGGTPQDAVQRDYGNTWQVVEQAAKAGLILNAIHPFKETDYPGYSSAGFKGRIHQSFLTHKGLSFMFIHSCPISPAPDICSFVASRESKTMVHKKLHLISNHPLETTKLKVEMFCKGLPSTQKDFKPFTIINPEIGEDTPANSYDDGSLSSALFQRVQQQISSGQKAFVVTDTEENVSVPISAGFFPITHSMVILRSYTEHTLVEDIESDLENTYQALIKETCQSISLSDQEDNEGLVQLDLGFSKSQFNLLKPIDCQKIRERHRKMYEWRQDRVRMLTECNFTCKECSKSGEATRACCKICELEQGYFREDKLLKAKYLVDSSKKRQIFSGGKLLFTCGLLNNTSVPTTDHGWVILVHLDNLTMVLHEISDIRLLWSSEKLFLHQYSNQKKIQQDTIKLDLFMPFSLFPPIYIHDISFWLTPDSTERTLLQAILDTTQHCVCDVWFRDRYLDKEKGRVSYNYRLIYSRCDGALSHIQTVQMQNLLRQVLIQIGFHLN